MQMTLLLVSFFAIAVIYSMVGLGGGTAYTAVMVLAGVPKHALPIVALTCNLIVSAQGYYHFKKAEHFRWRLFWPFAITSIPASYLGGSLHIPEKAFAIIMAIALSLAAIRFLFWKAKADDNIEHQPNIASCLLIGLGLGFLAGITGIGGGIYLIPVLLLLGWASAKEASAVAALFIFVNSASGLAGQITKGEFHDWRVFLPLALVALVGGMIGSRLGATKLKGETLQKIVGVVLIIAVIKLIGGLL